MVRTRARADPCVYCLETAIEHPVRLCATCPARACARCYEVALRRTILVPEMMAADIRCPACRRPSLPSFAQLTKSPALLATVAWQHDDSNYASFWRAVGRGAPPNLGMSRFVMCMYSLAAELRMHLLAHAVAGIDQADALARLRPRSDRAARMAAIAGAANVVTRDFDDCAPWTPPPSGPSPAAATAASTTRTRPQTPTAASWRSQTP